MTPAEVLKTLLTIRYSPRAKRPFPISWIARQAGYPNSVSLFRAIRRRSIAPAMARNLAPVLAKIQPAATTAQQGDIANTLGRLGGGTGRMPVGRALPRKPLGEDDWHKGIGRPAAPGRKAKVETRDG